MAYVAAADSTAVLPQLQAAVAQRLPEFMRPAAWVVLARLPLTPSGKVDRAALPAPARVTARGPRRAPRDGPELALAGLWADVLGIAEPGADDSFFDLGGQSLLAMRLLARATGQFGVTLTLKDFFDAPTIGGMARRIDALQGQQAATTDLQVISRAGPMPLSWGQERLWFLDQLDPSSPAYNIAWTIELRGAPDLPRLQAALDALVARHESLRSCFPTEAGRALQRIAPVLRVIIGVEAVRPAELAARREVLARMPFDLGAGPLLRATLLRLAPTRCELILVLHHIITDGTSNGLLFSELVQLYQGNAGLAPLPVQYADFAAWQRDWLEAGRSARQLDYWSERLRGAPPALELPADFPRPAEQRFRGAWAWRSLDGAQAGRLRALARERQCTLYMLMLATFNVLLQRYSGQDDLLVGTPVSARPHADLEHVVGLFINTIVLRTDLSGDPVFAELLDRVRATTVAAFAHQDVPFERLVERLRPERTLARAPVFQVMFNLVPMPERVHSAAGLEFRLGRLLDHGVSTFDLTLTVGDHAEGLELVFEYDTGLFRAGTIDAMADVFGTLLDSLPAQLSTPLSALPLLPSTVHAVPHTAWSGSSADTLVSLFAAQARAAPGAVAVVAGAEQLDYGELETRAARIARRLQAAGIGPGRRVGVCLPRTVDLVTAIMAILKAGAAFVPLDPAGPAARLSAMVQDADPALIISAGGAMPELPASTIPVLDVAALQADAPHDAAALPVQLSADDIAYVIYTSGSTGAPKGVAVTHASLVATYRGWEAVYQLAGTDVHLQMANVAFDVCVGDLVRALLSGARLVLCPRDALLDPAQLHALLWRERVTVAEFVPAVIRPLMAWLQAQGGDLACMRLVIVGSDVWHGVEYQTLRSLCAPGARVVNSYGVAEATIDSAWFESEAPAPGALPIGRPFPQAELHILDTRLRAVPAGVPGEICIGGPGVSRGYWRRPELTAARFVAGPAGGTQRLYRTGDRGRRRADGVIELLGRLDEQIKLRGFRIEAGEVESALCACPGVQASAVGLREAAGGDPRLVAWVAAAPGAAVVVTQLRAQLKARLPDYMVPAAFVVLDALPLTPNGKVDRRALPAPAWGEAGACYTTPRNPVEAALCGLFTEVLGAGAPVGIHDSFFDLGGHSLLATQLVSRIRDALGVELGLRALFENPTVAGISDSLPHAPLRSGEGPARQPALRAPLSLPQQRLWFLEQLEPGNAAYNLHAAFRVRGPLQLSALQQALQAVVDRHEILRTTFTTASAATPDVAMPRGLATAGAAPAAMPDVTMPPRLAIAGAAPAATPIEPECAPEQLIAPHLAVTLEQVDLADLSTDAVQTKLASLAAQPFDLARGPLIRVVLARAGREEQVLLLVMHHIIADGWSVAVLLRELAAAYHSYIRGETPGSAPLPVQYADYARWQRQVLEGPALGRQLDYWRQQLAGAPAVISLPLDRPRPSAQGYRGAWFTLTLPAALTPGVNALARRERATPFMVLLAAFATLLARYGGDEELCIGTPIAGRSRTELEGLIGFFVNTLVLRADLRGNPTFRELLARVRRTALEAYAQADVPFERLVQALEPVRSRAWSPLSQVLFAWHNEPRGELALDGVVATPEVIASEFVKFDLSLHVAEHEGALVTSFAYNTDLFDAVTVEGLAGSYAQLLAEVSGDAGQRVGEVALLDECARAQVQREAARVGPGPAWGGRQARAAAEERWPEATLSERFAAQVARAPQRLAVSWAVAADVAQGAGEVAAGGSRLAPLLQSQPTPDQNPAGAAPAATRQQWSYAELDQHARAIAQRIMAATGTDTGPVALLLGHDGIMIAGLLGVLQAGRAYVPLDPWSPRARNARVLADAGAIAIVTDGGRLAAAPWLTDTGLPVVLADELVLHRQEPARVGSEPCRSGASRDSPPDPDELAYILYTSGSSGEPKGVAQTQRNVLGHMRSWTNQLQISPDDRLALFSGYGFDAAVQDIFGALLNGASVHPLDLRGGHSAPALVDCMARERLTLLHFTPTVYRYLCGGRVTCVQGEGQSPERPHRDVRAGASNGGDATAGTPSLLPDVRLVVLGGEAARRSDLELFKVRFRRGARLVNGLGLTESTMALQYFADHDTRVLGQRLPIGQPVPGSAVVLLDAAGQPHPWQGEMALLSPCLSPGYHGDPTLTEERFAVVAAGAAPAMPRSGVGWLCRSGASRDPARATLSGPGAAPAATPIKRWLRTRDLARRLPDGQLLHTGRADAQVKIRGMRIESAEVEAALRQCAGVRDAAVIVRDADGSADTALLACIVSDVTDVTLVRQQLRERLPEFMVPSGIIVRADLPRLPNGKVDRQALRALPIHDSSAQAPDQALTQTAARLAALWRELLHRDDLGPRDDFFAVGGHSLLATRLVARLRDALGLEVPLVKIFEYPTLGEFAAWLEAQAAGADATPVVPAIPRLRRHPSGRGREGAGS